MSLVLTLPTDVEEQLAARATALGISPTACALQLLRAHLPQAARPIAGKQASHSPEDPTIALLGEWEREREAMSPEQQARADTEWDALTDAIDENRRAAGMRQLFP